MAAPMGNVCDLLFKTIFQDYSAKQSASISLKDVISLFGTNQIISSVESGGSLQEITSYINNCLGNSKLRAEGLLLLNVVVKQCSTDIFQQNAVTWIKLLVNILQGHCAVSVCNATCHCLKEIIQYSKSFSDVSREITTNVIPQLMPLLITSPDEVSESATSCINACIKNYPGPVGPFKNKLDNFILQKLDSNTNIKAVHRCYAISSQCGPGGSGGIKHTEAWAYQCHKLLGSLNSTVTELYDGLEIDYMQQGVDNMGLDLSPIGQDQKDRVIALVHRWHTLTSCMEFLLSEEMFTIVNVPADRILQLILRCLSINATILLDRPTQERCLLASYIPDIHIDALCILQHLIILCRRNLISHCTNVVGVLCQELVWTQTSNHGYSKQYSALRQKVYQVLTVWLKSLDGCSGILLEEVTLVKHLLQDCAPWTDTFQMTSEKGKMGDGPSKKKKRKGYQEISQGISTQRKLHPLANSELVTAAFDTLYWIITTAGPEMSGKKLQEIMKFVIHTLFMIQQSRDYPVPYSSVLCRKGLYSVLQACVLSPHPKVPSPVQCALQLFSTGILDKSIEVSSYCVEAMRVCEGLIHARAPCLNGPIICENVIHIGDVSLSTIGKLNNNTVNTNAHEMNGHDNNMDEISTENMDTSETLTVGNTLKRSRQAADLESKMNRNHKSSKQLKTGSTNNDDLLPSVIANNSRISDPVIRDKDDTVDDTVVIDSDSDNEGEDGESEDDVEIVGYEESSSSPEKDSGRSKEVEKESNTEDVDERDDISVEEVDASESVNEKEDDKGESEGYAAAAKGDDVNKEYGDKPTSQKDDKEPDGDVVNMMSAFIDAGPDSD